MRPRDGWRIFCCFRVPASYVINGLPFLTTLHWERLHLGPISSFFIDVDDYAKVMRIHKSGTIFWTHKLVVQFPTNSFCSFLMPSTEKQVLYISPLFIVSICFYCCNRWIGVLAGCLKRSRKIKDNIFSISASQQLGFLQKCNSRGSLGIISEIE